MAVVVVAACCTVATPRAPAQTSSPGRPADDRDLHRARYEDGAFTATPSGLRYVVVHKGSGAVAQPGQHVLIHETTRFEDGRVYFTTTGRLPLRFLLGGNQVIAGVDEGVTGMRVGERRRLIVPPSLSRRSTYPDGLSPDAILHYDVTLVAIEPPGVTR